MEGLTQQQHHHHHHQQHLRVHKHTYPLEFCANASECRSLLASPPSRFLARLQFSVLSHYGTMGIVTNILTVVFLISFLTFIAFFGRLPIFRRTPIGFAHRLIWVHIPKVLSKVDGVLTGGRMSGCMIGSWNRLLYKKHPVVLIFFLGLVSSAASIFLPSTWPFLTTIQKITVLLLIPQPFIWTYLCNRVGPNAPHIITHETHAEHMMHYPFDYKLFHPNIVCRTCNFIKPARSKHCSLCGGCVARSDHHCIWVNNCLGRGNYRYFLGLLVGTSAMLAYGTYLAYITLEPQVRLHWATYPEWHAPAPGTQEWVVQTRDQGIWEQALARGEYYLDVLATALLAGGIGRGGVGLLCLLTAPLPASLLGYHIYLIWLGATTNESGKWSDWKEDIADNLAFIAPILEQEQQSVGHSNGFATEKGVARKYHHQHSSSAPVHSIDQMPNVHQQQTQDQQDNWPSYQPPSATLNAPQLSTIPDSPSNPDPTVNDSSWRWSPWPKRSTQFMVCTNDGHVPRLLQPHITSVVGTDPQWRRVRSLKEIENTYDLGFWENLKDLVLN